MAGKQAKILADDDVLALRDYAWRSRYPLRNDTIVLLSVKAGLRAAEIAALTWPMVTTADGGICTPLELRDCAAKRGSGRRIPLHAHLVEALTDLQQISPGGGPVIRSERGGHPLLPVNIVHWFERAYRAIGLAGCSSHSGRRTFITRAARSVYDAGGSLRDVQLLAGHRSIVTTQRYIEGDSDAQRRLVALI